MEAIKKYMNYLGLALVFLGLVSLKIWPQYRTLGLVVVVLGIAAIAVYIALNLAVLKQGFKRKSFLYSSNMLLVVILVLAILAVVNYFLSRHHKRFDFTAAKIHSLSDQSVKLIGNLKNDVVIKAFFREGNYSRGQIEDMLKIYAYHSKKIKYEFIDPDKNPGLVKRYEIAQDGTTILECGDKENRITTATEEDITNAIIKVTREKKKAVYFLEGHGEPSIEETGDDGYSYIKDELGKMGYEVRKLSLALSENFPKDCSLLVVPGPKKDLLPNELETIKGYINGGGRVFFMVDPETAPGLTPYLAGFGFKLENDLVVDTISRLFGGDYFMPVISEYEDHEITRKFRYASFFPYARSVDLVEPKPEGVTLTILAKTSANSWAERQLDQKTAKFDKDKDKPGPIAIAAVALIKATELPKEEPLTKQEVTKPEEKKAPAAPEAQKEGRVAVFGDSDFASNRYYNLSGNGNLFLNTVNWLTEESDLISIQPKTSSPRTIQLTPSQGRLIFFVSVLILPLIVLVLGISVWVRRRSL
jgi:ABC-type uncharacterized transport system involved in gliding motility auxiliary subunit